LNRNHHQVGKAKRGLVDSKSCSSSTYHRPVPTKHMVCQPKGPKRATRDATKATPPSRAHFPHPDRASSGHSALCISEFRIFKNLVYNPEARDHCLAFGVFLSVRPKLKRTNRWSHSNQDSNPYRPSRYRRIRLRSFFFILPTRILAYHVKAHLV
jgi:hypothetical protein